MIAGDEIRKKLKEQADFDLDFAIKMLVRDGRFAPIFIGLEADPKMINGASQILLMAGWRNDKQKQAQVTAVRLAFGLARCQMCSVISEAWTLPGDSVTEEHRRGASIAEHEDRVELLYVFVESIHGLGHEIGAKILRDADGNVTGVERPFVRDRPFALKEGDGSLQGLLGAEVPPDLIVLTRDLIRSEGRTREQVLH